MSRPQEADYTAPPAIPPTVDTTTDRIIRTASTNTDLLVTLSSTSSAPNNFASSGVSLKTHRREHRDQQAIVDTLRAESDAAAKTYQKYANSRTGRRYLYMLVCMRAGFDKKMEESERVHQEKLQARREAEERLAGLQKNLDEAKRMHDENEAVVQVHNSAHGRLDELYEEVFKDETTADYPEQQRLRDDFARKYVGLVAAKENYYYEVGRRGNTDGLDERVAKVHRVKEELKRTAREVEEARQALELERERVYERVVGFGQAPPPYSNCCNREECQDVE